MPPRPKKYQDHTPPAPPTSKKGHKPIKWTKAVLDGIAVDIVDYFRDNPTALFIAQYLADKEIPRQRMYEKLPLSPDLQDALDLVKTICESRIAVLGMQGQAPPAMAIFSLKNCGWTDRQEIKTDNTHSGDMGLKISFSTVPDSNFQG